MPRRRWIAAFFEAKPISEAGEIVNHGVYLVAGEAWALCARPGRSHRRPRALRARPHRVGATSSQGRRSFGNDVTSSIIVPG